VAMVQRIHRARASQPEGTLTVAAWPNNRLRVTANSVRSCLAPAVCRA